jgi:hypothetical protein
MSTIPFPKSGKCSQFGGPNDTGVGPDEGLGLVEPQDLATTFFRELFLPYNPPGTTGLARRLNPHALYCAMRWAEYGITRSTARVSLIKVSFGDASTYVRPVDVGPGDGTVFNGVTSQDTGRIIDLSPGALAALCCRTDDVVLVEVV